MKDFKATQQHYMSDPQDSTQRVLLAHQARSWSDQVLAMSGLLEDVPDSA